MRHRIVATLIGIVFSLASVMALGGDDRIVASAQPIMTRSPTPLPGDSLYQLPITLTTASGTSVKLSEIRGAPTLITMFYSRCSSVCPLLTTQLQQITQRLSVSEQRQVHVLMVSFDSAQDTPESLNAFVRAHHISGENWMLARASASDVRLLAAALGIQYRELPDHTFNHSTLISLADREGVIRGSTSNLSDINGDFVAAIHRQLVPAGQSANP